MCNDATFDQFNVSFLNKILSEFSTKTKHFIDFKVLNSGVVYITPFSVAFARFKQNEPGLPTLMVLRHHDNQLERLDMLHRQSVRLVSTFMSR